MAAPGGADCSRLGGLTQEGTVISNMPLLFADGFPTSLDTMTESQLEKFIPFMIHCALGINPYEHTVLTEAPVWWPCTITFKFPLRRPACFASGGKWTKTLRSLVHRCYVHHECQFMLNFSDELVTTPTSLMKFVDLCDGTTELRDKRSGKLLVTFRNENRAYDKIPESPRRHMQLLPRSPRPEKPPLFNDIYLCESCDAEFETLEQVKSHEVVCHSHNEQEEDEEGDVVAIGAGAWPETLDHQGHFLGRLSLVERSPERSAAAGSALGGGDLSNRSPRRSMPKRSRQGSLSFAKCTSVPISSPMGRALLRQHARPLFTISPLVAERTERYCSKPFATKAFSSPRPSSTRSRCQRMPRHERWVHSYSFSARERRQRFATLDTGLDGRSRHLLARCKVLEIVLQRLTELEIARHSCASAMECHDSGQADHYTRPQPIPVIDLCISSDEEACPPTSNSLVDVESLCVPSVPSMLLHQLTCARSKIPYRLDRSPTTLASDANMHLKIEPLCIQKRVKSSSGGPSENRVLGVPFLGRKSSGLKLFHLLEPDSKGKLKELNKIKKSNCVSTKVNFRVKCGESR